MTGQPLAAILPPPDAPRSRDGHGFAVYDTVIATPHGPKIRVDFVEAQIPDYPGWRAITLHSAGPSRRLAHASDRSAGARAAALADIRTYETLNARVLAAGTLTTAKAPRRQGAPATVAQQSATALGLTIAAQPADGGLRVTLTDAQYDTVLAWLADLAGTSDLRVRGIALTRGTQPGRVSGTVDLGA